MVNTGEPFLSVINGKLSRYCRMPNDGLARKRWSPPFLSLVESRTSQRVDLVRKRYPLMLGNSWPICVLCIVMHLYHFVWVALFFCSTQLVLKVNEGYQGANGYLRGITSNCSMEKLCSPVFSVYALKDVLPNLGLHYWQFFCSGMSSLCNAMQCNAVQVLWIHSKLLFP